jgi:hypothetical protein
LQVDHAHQLAARGHRHRQLGADGVHGVQVARIVADVAHQHRLAARRGRSGDAFADRDRQVAHHVLAMAHAVADAQVAALLVVEQDGEQVVGQHAVDDLGDIGEELIEIECLGRRRRHFEQEVEQLGALAESDRGFTWCRLHLAYRSLRLR